MKISFEWLNEYIDISDYKDRLEDLEHILTQAGLEVEGLEAPSQHWDKVVVGKIVEFGRHPDADRLTLCQVDVGGSELSQIVCGATNHKLGDTVVAAIPGAVLPGNFKIKKSKIRGVESAGMLCSEKELGLGTESDGIMILKDGVKPGTSFSEFYGGGDAVFELNVTPNRADCLSHLGLARELSALLERPLKLEELKSSSGQGESQVSIEVSDPESCPRYCGRVISGIQVKESPDWLKRRLQAVGINTHNNVVDITNYVMLELGQPLHAFDLKQLKGQKIIVRKASEGEKFVSLDQTEMSLSSDDLLICDGERPVALAGVVGGKNSGVEDDTKDLFLEGAFFAAKGVRKTARHHGIETDAGYRFSRGVDPFQTLIALERASQLFVELAGGTLEPGFTDCHPRPQKRSSFVVDTSYVAQRLGYSVDEKSLTSFCERVGCKVSSHDDGLMMEPPSFRWDISIKEDIVEEYGRLNGYDKIQEKLPPLVGEPSPSDSFFSKSQMTKNLLVGLGCFEATNYGFIPEGVSGDFWNSKSGMGQFGFESGSEDVVVSNPLSEEFKVMRRSLLPGLVKNVQYNDRHGQKEGRLFELGPVYSKKQDEYFGEQHLGFAFWGESEGLWRASRKNHILYSLKTTVEGYLMKLGAKSWRWDSVKDGEVPGVFHPGQVALLNFEGKPVGLFGTLHPQWSKTFKIKSPVAIGEFNWDRIMTRWPRVRKFTSLGKFPGTERDITVLVPSDQFSGNIISHIRKKSGPLLKDVWVHDVYEDKELKETGRKSVTFRLYFESPKETLNDGAINAVLDKVRSHLSEGLSLEIR